MRDATITKKSKNGKAPASYGVNAELIKYGGKRLHERYITDAKRIGRRNCGNSTQDHAECKNYTGITLIVAAYTLLH